jgi:hypothetical protein
MQCGGYTLIDLNYSENEVALYYLIQNFTLKHKKREDF